MSDEKSCIACEEKTEILEGGLYDDRYAFPHRYDLYQCMNCEHIFLDHDLQDEDLGELYTKYYPRSSFDVNSFQPLKEVKGFEGWLNGEKRAFAYIPKNVKVLDIGCGYGESVAYHKGRDCDSYGCEADKNVEEVAKKYDLNIKIGIFKADMFKENFFDFVTMDQVLEHATDPLSTLNEIYKVLKPGGKLILSFPNAHGYGAKKFGRQWIHWHVPYHMNFYSPRSLKLIAEKSSFKLEKVFTHTSSEWLYYQHLQDIRFPKFKEKSVFFSPDRDLSELNVEEEERRNQLAERHRKKYFHWKTRALDIMRKGDNYVAFLQKL